MKSAKAGRNVVSAEVRQADRSPAFGAQLYPIGSLLSRPLVVRQVGQYPFPLQWLVKLRYSQDALLTTVNGASASVASLRLNSCYRPDYSAGTTNQPYQWDQLTGIYATYKVLGARVKLDFWNPSTDGLMVGYRVRSPNDVATAGYNIRFLQEVPNCQITNLAVGATERVTFAGKVDFPQIMGYSREQFGGVLPVATTANAQYGDILLDIWVIDLNANTTRTVDYCATVEYDVQMDGYVAPSES
jgi:hypothetical protein